MTSLWNMAVAASEVLSPASKNPSNFSGAVDIIIIKHNDNLYKSTPFHVRFGKYLAQYPYNLTVNITVNDEKINNFKMHLNKQGIAHFDGRQDPELEEKEKEEQKAETDEPVIIQTNNKPKEKKGRKRDKLRAFVQSSWSYWSGGEEEENEDKPVKTDNVKTDKPRKRDFITNYLTNNWKSQWMIEQDVIDINNIPTMDHLKLFADKLKPGKNGIAFSVETPSKMEKFKQKVKKKKTKTDNTENEEEEENSDDDVIIESEKETLNVELKQRLIFGNIYLWDISDKIIISDVDGTITKSDLGGHVLPKIGFDYCQNGICEMLNRINSNGYRIVYLTARGIGQSSLTRKYLFDELNVPNGAVICSPSTTRAALYREVIQKRPQDFKIPTLNMIVKAFNDDKNNTNNDESKDKDDSDKYNPFIGGFGNRDTDAKTYNYFGIGKAKTFIILDDKHAKKMEKDKDINNKENEVEATYIKDYNEIFENINDTFPKLPEKE